MLIRALLGVESETTFDTTQKNIPVQTWTAIKEYYLSVDFLRKWSVVILS